MAWTPQVRSATAESIHASAAEDERANPVAYSLNPDVIVERALGLGVDSTDQFLDGWRDGLEQYLASLQEDGRLNALGRRMMGEQAIGKLVSTAKVTRRLAVDPERAAADLLPPIVIVGGWRSGTTFLFRLLATDPRLRAPLPMELTRPWRFAGMPAGKREEVLAKLDAAPNPLQVLNPELRHVHDHGPRLPEECVLALGADLRSWGLSSTVRLDGYSKWLATQDLGPSYREYRRVLRLLDERDGRRFVLKAPAHTAELRTLVDTFPGAIVVHLHRDVVETISSGASLFAVFRSTYSDHVDPVDVGCFLTDQTELWFRRAAEHRADPATAGATFVDVEFTDLVADPVSVIADIYAAADLDPPADPSAFVDDYHRSSPRHEHGTHRYTADDFGLDVEAIRARFADISDRPS